MAFSSLLLTSFLHHRLNQVYYIFHRKYYPSNWIPCPFDFSVSLHFSITPNKLHKLLIIILFKLRGTIEKNIYIRILIWKVEYFVGRQVGTYPNSVIVFGPPWQNQVIDKWGQRCLSMRCFTNYSPGYYLLSGYLSHGTIMPSKLQLLTLLLYFQWQYKDAIKQHNIYIWGIKIFIHAIFIFIIKIKYTFNSTFGKKFAKGYHQLYSET